MALLQASDNPSVKNNNLIKPFKFKYKLFDNIEEELKWNTLNDEQKNFCYKVLSGENIFLTGAAGTGKSFVLNFIFKFLSKQNISFGKTAMSGITALNIKGSTLHSFLGVGLADRDDVSILKMVYKNKKARARIEGCKILFIDEVSMLSGKLFDTINFILKRVKNTREEFGGIQVVLSGDFLQLPPIFRDLDNNCLLFESKSYKNGLFRKCEFFEIVRQKEDKEYAELLNEIRKGNLSNIWKIKERIGAKLDLPEGIRPVRLLGYNKSVDSYNKQCLESIEEQSKNFKSIDYGEQHHLDSFERNCPVSKLLTLKKGAQVTLCWNVDVEDGFVNGLLGSVTGFASDGSPIVKFVNKKSLVVTPQTWEIFEQVVIRDVIKYKSVASRIQIPLKLAYASTIHSCQGQTLDFAVLDLEQVFTESQAYVALSRVKKLNGISILRDFDESKIKVNKKCLEFYSK